MELTNKQEEGLRIAIERHRNHEKYTVISGYAGTGKSTLVKFIIQALDVEESRVCYAAFTGKAAEVLRKKGNKNAMTIHKLLYDHIPKPGGGFLRKKKTTLEYDIIVIDEVSMVPKEMVDLLLTHQVYVIFLGDPFQLPPIDKDSDNHLLDNPHVFLDEIMRQAADSEIIRLTLAIREGKSLELFDGSNVKIFNKNQLIPGMMTWADQIIVAKNATRKDMNAQMRAMLERGPMPEEGDKIVCLRNYWDDLSDSGDALVNGTIGYLKNPMDKLITFPKIANTEIKSMDGILTSIVTDTDEEYYNITADKKMLLTEEKTLDWRDLYKLGKLKPRLGDLVPKELAYGYAITCWKAQGSEWNKVLAIEENFPFDKTEHARWLYTAATRAAEKLVLIRS